MIITILFGILLYGNDIDNLKMMTEEYPPYNYSENGLVIGIFPDLMGEMLKKVGDKINTKGYKNISVD